MKKRTSSIILMAFICTVLIGVGSTMAYLIASTRPVVNTFEAQNIEVTLNESTENDFKLIPGVTHKKDPTVTVKGETTKCWIFIKAQPSADLYMYADYQIDSGWIPLEGEANIYYREFHGAATDTVYPILKDNTVTVHEDITEAELELIKVNPTLKFKVYAIQRDGFDTPDDAWDAVILEKGE